MTLEEALTILDTVLHETQLNDTQESVFRSAWAGQTYQEIAQDLNFATEYIRAVGAQLWNALSEAFGEKVTKQNVRTVLERWARQNLGMTRKPLPSAVHKHQDWGEAVDVSTFFGRSDELATLKQWIVQDHCRLVALLGMGGLGKTSLSVKLAQEIQNEFEFLVWRSLRNAPPLPELLTSLLHFLTGGQEGQIPQDVSEQLSQLIHCLRQHRCLLILDNAEMILHAEDGHSRVLSGQFSGQYREGYENYGEFFQRLAQVPHRSCLVLTSREKPREIDVEEGATEPVRSLHLRGLTSREGQELFRIRGAFSASEAEWQALVQHYAGNPLALKIVAATIQDLFDSDISKFVLSLQQGTLVFDDIRDLLRRQFERLRDDRLEIMYWLAINRELVSLAELQEDLVSFGLKQRSLEALKDLGRRFLIERSAKGFTQQPVVMEYLIEQFVEQVCQEICEEKIHWLMSHALIKAQAKNYIRDSQMRLILAPITDRLCELLRSPKNVELKLQKLLAKLRAERLDAPGYAAGNLLNLLHQLKVDLTGYDFSHLTVWQAYLQGVNLHQVNFAHADLTKSVFTETLGNVWAVAFSPDGRLLAAGDTANTIHIWRVADGKKLLTCTGHSNWISCIAFSTTANLLASGSADNTVKLWDTTTGQCVRTLHGHIDWVLSVAFSPQGTQLASSSADTCIKLWDLARGDCCQTLEGHRNWVRSIAFVPQPAQLLIGEAQTALSQTILASGSADDTVKLWDGETGKCLQTWTSGSNGVWAIALSPDGQLLATGGGDSSLKLWRLATGHCLNTLRGHTSHVRSVSFGANGYRLASGSEDQTIRLWEVQTGECLKTLQGHSSAVWSVACTADILASGSLDQRVKLWDIRTGHCLSTLQGYTDFVWAIALTPYRADSAQTDLETAITSSILASGSADHTIKLWDIHTGNCCKTLQGHGNWVLSVAFNPNQQTFVSGSFDQTIRLWDLQTGHCLRILRGHSNWVLSVKFSPDTRTVASASFDRTVRLWDSHTGECLQVLRGHAGRVWSVAYHPQGEVLASGSEDQTIRLWNCATGDCQQILQGHTGRIWSVAFSPEGHWLASAGEDCTIRLWDSRTGDGLRVLQGHHSRVQAVAFSLDGKWLASGGEDRTIKLWNPATGECLKTLQGHSNRVWSLAFGCLAPESSAVPARLQPILASGSEDETIRLWDVVTGACLKTLRGPRPYQGMNITEATGLTAAQKETLKALGAIELSDLPGPYTR